MLCLLSAVISKSGFGNFRAVTTFFISEQKFSIKVNFSIECSQSHRLENKNSDIFGHVKAWNIDDVNEITRRYNWLRKPKY